MSEGLGINVLRQVPLEYIAGIASQIYSVHGGVIREALTEGGRLAVLVPAKVSGAP